MRWGSSPISRHQFYTVSIFTYAPRTPHGPHEASGRQARHRHITCACSRTLRDLRRHCRTSAQPYPIGSGRAHARPIALRKHTITRTAARGHSEPPWVDHPRSATGAPMPLTDTGNSWSSQPTSSIRIESSLRLNPRVVEPGLTRGDFRQLSMHREHARESPLIGLARRPPD